MKQIPLAVVFLLAVLLAGCSAPTAASPTTAANPPTSAPTAVPLEAGMGGLAGQAAGASGRWNGEQVMVYAAPFTRVAGEEEGFYVLEPEIHPHTALDASGNFQLGAVQPGEYVLVIGPSARDGKLVINEKGKPKVFTVKAGEILQAGALVLSE